MEDEMRLLLGAGLLGLLLATPAAAQERRHNAEIIGFSDFNFLTTERPLPDGFRSGQFAGHLGAE